MTEGETSQQLTAPPTLLGRYELIREIGRGGMGVVHEARDTALQRIVAVKVLQEAGEDAEARFRWEVRIVAEMDHPGIVPIYDFGQDDRVFFVMPLVRGNTLRARLGRGRLPEAITLSIGAQVADALDYSHARGVTHRDVKPENILVLAGDPRDVRVKVMDFGVAVRSGHTPHSPKIVGTPGYLAPEQIRGDESDARTDVYALGVVLYECLTGAELFGGTIHMKLLSALSDEPPSPRALAPDIGEATESLVLRCLSKRPDDRPASAGALAEALRDAMKGVQSSAQVPIERRPLSEPRVPALLGAGMPRSFPGRSDTLVDLRGTTVEAPHARGRGDAATTIASGRAPEGAAPAALSDAAGPGDQLGELLLRNGDYPAAESAFRAAYAARRAQADALAPAEEARHLLRLARLAYRRGRYEEALAQGLAGVEHLGQSEPLVAAELFAASALACCMAGRLDEAAALLGSGFSRLADAPGQRLAQADAAAAAIVEARLLRTLGNLRLGRGQPAAAAVAYEQGLACCERATDAWELSIALFNVGDSLVRAGAYEEAQRYLDRAYAAKAALGDRWGLSYTHAARARIALDRSELNRAARELRAGLGLSLAIGDPKLCSIGHAMEGRIGMKEGRLDDAERSFELAYEEAVACKAAPEIAVALVGRSTVWLARGDTDRALTYAREARDIAASSGGLAERGAALLALGNAEAAAGRPETASRLYVEALAIMDSTLNPHRQAEVRAAMDRLWGR